MSIVEDCEVTIEMLREAIRVQRMYESRVNRSRYLELCRDLETGEVIPNTYFFKEKVDA